MLIVYAISLIMASAAVFFAYRCIKAAPTPGNEMHWKAVLLQSIYPLCVPAGLLVSFGLIWLMDRY